MVPGQNAPQGAEMVHFECRIDIESMLHFAQYIGENSFKSTNTIYYHYGLTKHELNTCKSINYKTLS